MLRKNAYKIQFRKYQETGINGKITLKLGLAVSGYCLVPSSYGYYSEPLVSIKRGIYLAGEQILSYVNACRCFDWPKFHVSYKWMTSSRRIVFPWSKDPIGRKIQPELVLPFHGQFLKCVMWEGGGHNKFLLCEGCQHNQTGHNVIDQNKLNITMCFLHICLTVMSELIDHGWYTVI